MCQLLSVESVKCALVQCKVYGVPHALGMGHGVFVVCLCEIPCTLVQCLYMYCVHVNITSHGVSGRVLV